MTMVKKIKKFCYSNVFIYPVKFFFLHRNTMEAMPATCLRDVRSMALKACVIGIDEGQFVSLSPLHTAQSVGGSAVRTRR